MYTYKVVRPIYIDGGPFIIKSYIYLRREKGLRKCKMEVLIARIYVFMEEF